MELIIVSLIGLMIVAAMIGLVAIQTKGRNDYWDTRKAYADEMSEKDREWLAEHNVYLPTHKKAA